MKSALIILICAIPHLNLHSQVISQLYDSIDFETPYAHILLNQDSIDLWQIGQPEKLCLDSAASGSNVIITDTVADYPPNNHSFFDLRIGTFNMGSYGGGNIHILFSHKIDSDTLRDGGYITTSTDGGQSWNDVFSPIDLEDGSGGIYAWEYPANFYGDWGFGTDTLYNGEWGFSGKQDWNTTYFGWLVPPVNPQGAPPPDVDTLLVRFNFISDSLDNQREGWMIDDILLFSYWVSSIDEVQPAISSIYPNPTNDGIILAFHHIEPSVTLKIYSVTGRLIDKMEYDSVSQIYYPNVLMSAGVYEYVIETEKSREVYSVVIER